MTEQIKNIDSLPVDTTILRFKVTYPVSEESPEEDFSTFIAEVPKFLYSERGEDIIIDRTLKWAFHPKCKQVQRETATNLFEWELEKEISLEDFISS